MDFFSESDIPDFLQGLSIVEVQKVEKDLGPATKYLYTLLRLDPNTLCVVLDDDMYYPADLISTLVKFDQESDGTSVFCVNGLRVPRELVSEKRESDKEIKSGQKKVAIVEGCGGYTLRKRYVAGSNLFDLTGAPARSFFDDDFWLSGHLSRNNIKKYQIPLQGRRKSLVNTIESAISGDRAKLQTDLMKFFANDWKADEYF